MHNVTVSKNVNIAKDKVWETISEFGGIYKFHPDVESSQITNNVEKGLGAQRVCNFYGGGSIVEKIIEFKEGQSIDWAITDSGPFPIKEARGGISVRALSNKETNIIFRMDFQPKFGPIGWLMANLMMKKQFKEVLTGIIRGLEDHVRTGQIVGTNGELQSGRAA